MLSRSRIAVLGAAIACLLALTGCFRPMYASIDGQPSAIDELARVDIPPIEGRVGLKVRNELLYAFSAGTAADAPYKLVITLHDKNEGVILRQTTEAETTIYDLRANFTLIEVATGKVLHGGTSVARASFDTGTQMFAAQRAEIDAQNRAAKVVAENIKTRIAAYFAARNG